MVDEINDNMSTLEKLQWLAEKLMEPNAAIRVGRSIITQNTAGSLDLVINNTYISLIPNIEAVYFIDLETQREKQELGDCILYLFDIPDNGIGVSQMSQAGYTWFVRNENAFLECTYGIGETDRIFHQNKLNVVGIQGVTKGPPFDLSDAVVKLNDFGGCDMVVDDVYVSFNCGVKVVYFMPEAVRKEMDEHARSYWWSLFCDVTESGIAVVQRSKAGFTWWVYDEKAYVAKCERNGGMDPTQFKISPNRVY